MAKDFNLETTGVEVVKALPEQVEGKTILITGAGENGLGGETAIALAHGNPAHLILTARSQGKVQSVINKIKELNPRIQVTFIPLQLDDYDSVRAAASTANSSISQLDILINNAGVMNIETYQTNKHGVELQFATNHVGHFLLTKLLYPKLLAAAPGSKIVNISSLGHLICPVFIDDYNFSNGADYDGWSGYGQSKTANILFTQSLAQRLGSKGIFAFSVHPGTIIGTGLAAHIQDPMKSLEDIAPVVLKRTGVAWQGIDALKQIECGITTQLIAALDPRLESSNGAHLADNVVKEPSKHARDQATADKLWELSEKLIGEKFDA